METPQTNQKVGTNTNTNNKTNTSIKNQQLPQKQTSSKDELEEINTFVDAIRIENTFDQKTSTLIQDIVKGAQKLNDKQFIQTIADAIDKSGSNDEISETMNKVTLSDEEIDEEQDAMSINSSSSDSEDDENDSSSSSSGSLTKHKKDPIVATSISSSDDDDDANNNNTKKHYNPVDDEEDDDDNDDEKEEKGKLKDKRNEKKKNNGEKEKKTEPKEKEKKKKKEKKNKKNNDTNSVKEIKKEKEVEKTEPRVVSNVPSNEKISNISDEKKSKKKKKGEKKRPNDADEESINKMEKNKKAKGITIDDPVELSDHYTSDAEGGNGQDVDKIKQEEKFIKSSMASLIVEFQRRNFPEGLHDFFKNYHAYVAMCILSPDWEKILKSNSKEPANMAVIQRENYINDLRGFIIKMIGLYLREIKKNNVALEMTFAIVDCCEMVVETEYQSKICQISTHDKKQGNTKLVRFKNADGTIIERLMSDEWIIFFNAWVLLLRQVEIMQKSIICILDDPSYKKIEKISDKVSKLVNADNDRNVIEALKIFKKPFIYFYNIMPKTWQNLLDENCSHHWFM